VTFSDAVTAVEGVLIAAAPVMVAVAIAKIREVHFLINSRLTELIEMTKTASRAEGVIEGRDNVRAEIANQSMASGQQEKPPCTV
jgi:hypothetical protein